ncbi:MAG: hypothetical protein OXT64_03230 [Gammaproteobacteria bacterium]|nr:hypothetical protein [Gammaproteobacteria bacterium]MDE0451347.1 hypothetical protein [Gammaproteobacteria bacterium]
MRLKTVGSNQSTLPAGILTVCLSFVGGCTTEQARDVDNWVTDSSNRCEALSISYAVVGPTLQSILGPNFVPQLDPSTGRGTLVIEMYGCRSAPLVTRLHGPYQAGRVLIALDGSQAPIAVTGTDRWDSYVLHIGGDDEPLTRFMKTNDVATFAGHSTLPSLDESGEHALVGKIHFPQGSITVRAPRTCSSRPYDQRRAIVGTGRAEFSLFVGTESGLVCKLEDAQVAIEGITPFSDLGLDSATASTEYREAVLWDFTIWRQANLGLE